MLGVGVRRDVRIHARVKVKVYVRVNCTFSEG